MTAIYILVICLVIREFNLIIALSFVVLYAIFVIVVVVQSKIYNQNMQNAIDAGVEDER